MKKLFLGIAILGLSIGSVANAQTTTVSSGNTGFYLGVGVGYSLPISTNGSSNFDTYKEFEETNGNSTYENVPFSLGKGANFGIDLGYMFTPYLGAELGIDYFMGSKTSIYSYEYAGDDYTENQDLSGKMIQFKPTLVFKAGTGNVVPYGKVGLVVGVGSKITSNYTEKMPSEDWDLQYDMEFKGGTALGFHGAVGVDYAINNKVSLFGEITAIGLNYSPKEGKYTKYWRNGTDYLDQRSTSQKEFEFVDSFDDYDNNDSDKPTKAHKFSTPFSSVGLNIGAKFKF